MLQELEETLKGINENINLLIDRVGKIETKQANGTQKLSYSTKEASEVLGLKPSTIRKLIEDGKLTATRTGKNLLIHTESIVNLLKMQTV